MRTKAARATPRGIAGRMRGLSDRAIAWIFITPSILILLAINIFPLLWTVYLSFTNFRANQPGRPVQWIGTANYERILSSEDIWGYLQVTAHFVVWTMVIQVGLGLGLGAAHQSRLPHVQLLDDGHPHPDDAVARRRRHLLDLSLPAADRHFQLHRRCVRQYRAPST